MEQELNENMMNVLKNELVKALGCTEPIAIAYVSAKAAEVLGCIPERIEIACSGNIIKNAKSAVVPMTGGMRGIEAAAIAGAIGGKADKQLEVLMEVTNEELRLCNRLLWKKMCTVSRLETMEKLHIIEKMFAGSDEVEIELARTHLGITRIEKMDRLFLKPRFRKRKTVLIIPV